MIAAADDLRPTSPEQLVRVQETLAEATAIPWRPNEGVPAIGGCFVTFQRGSSGLGAAGDPAWAAATVVREGRPPESAVVRGQAGAPYRPGLLYLREGRLLEAAVNALAERTDVLLVNGTGADHPRRAGLALHLGALLNLATVGVTHRPLRADGPWPDDEPGSTSPLLRSRPVKWCKSASSC